MDAEPRTIFTGHAEANALAVGGEQVLWAEYTRVLACPKPGCDGDPVVLATNQRAVSKLTVDEKNAYWVSSAPEADGVRNSIVECPLSGCGESPRVLASVHANECAGLALDMDHVYFTTDTGGSFTAGIDSVEK